MKRWAKRIQNFLLIICLIVISFPTNAHDDEAASLRIVTKESFPGAAKFDRQAAYSYSQSAIGKKLGDYKFIDTNNKVVRLDQFRGKPLIISMIYSSCYHTCPMLTQNLADAVEKGGKVVTGGARHELGGNFFQPTVVAHATPEMRFAKEEIFGPLAPVFEFEHEADAVNMIRP